MKDDYISRKAAIDAVAEWFFDTNDLRQPKEVLCCVPSAQPERKKGKWVKVHGYATPGGDPVWACSECGKGIHVYGIEHSSYGKDVADGQWVACPNCGAEMLGEIWTK